ncbi:hypothetical protein [Pseudomonas arsenicoxydans]|uniref:hypothetical protein n=1 Tax=Pseudomonas arsenicoxydans TaxID=702115 RepID=UPI00137572F3|nr:hypothetical protein [Pseudomonas arsenicoxydans]
MTSKKLRILIADMDFGRRFEIEKTLNRLGQYSVMPVKSFEELVIYSFDFTPSFDVLIADLNFMIQPSIDLLQFCQKAPGIPCKLFYNYLPAGTIIKQRLCTRPYSYLISSPTEKDLSDFIAHIN